MKIDVTKAALKKAHNSSPRRIARCKSISKIVVKHKCQTNKRVIRGLPACTSNHRAMSGWYHAMCKRVDKHLLPGFASCVIHRGMLKDLREYGYADVERKVPFTKDTIVRTYCMTKTVVAVGICILQERGLLNVTDPVSKYLPAFKRLRVVRNGHCMFDVEPDAPNVSSKFTILRLLTHTAGIGYGADFGEKSYGGEGGMYAALLDSVDDRKTRTLEHFVDQLAKLPLRNQPAGKLNYSMGHDVLARIIEVVSGRTLDVFLRDEICKPLGMADTGFMVPRHKASRLAALYGTAARAARVNKKLGQPASKHTAKSDVLHRIDGDSSSESWWIGGRHCEVFSGNGILGTNTGGLVSTLSDMARFYTMLLNGGALGNHRILQTSTVEQWCFQNLLPLPGCQGKARGTGGPWSGWGALGEVGNERWKRDAVPLSDEYEAGEVAMGGVAQTVWSVNPVRDSVTLFFTQALDSVLWEPDVVIDGVSTIHPANFTPAARAIAPRDSAAAALRRRSL